VTARLSRRDFAAALGAALGAAAGPAGLGAAVTPPPRHWAWVHGTVRRTPAQWARQFRRLRASGFHGVHVGGGDAAALVEATFEGYGPGGVAIILQVVTDNRNRAVSDIRTTLTRGGGSLGESGSVAWQFQKKGSIVVGVKLIDEERLLNLALEAGAQDMSRDGEFYTILTDPQHLEVVKHALAALPIRWESADLALIPSSLVRVEDPALARRILTLLDDLEDHDDVQHVFANFDIPDAILAEHAAS